MTSSLRLLVVTARYWPHAAGMERQLANWVETARRQGAELRVLTASWSPDWPSCVWHREVQVNRLSPDPLGGWSALRYLRSLYRWLRRHRQEWDAVHVANMRYEAFVVLGALGREPIEVSLQLEAGYLSWHETARWGHRIQRRCQDADVIIASSRRQADALHGVGFARHRIHQLGPGVRTSLPSPPESRLVDMRHGLREALGAINTNLDVHSQVPIAIWIGRLDASAQLEMLLPVWERIQRQKPNARLWIIGDGPGRAALYEAILHRGQHHAVFLPGSFDELHELFLAANVYLAWQQDFDLARAPLEALAAGLPIIGPDTPVNRAMMQACGGVHLIPDTADAWVTAVCQLWDDPAQAEARSVAARRWAAAHLSLDQAVTDHLHLLSLLAANKRRKTS